jgi:hypothetical protein
MSYSRGINALKYLAPAIPQRAALLLMEEIIKAGMEATFFNTLAFLSFQSSHAVRRSKDTRPFRRLPWALEIAQHHSWRLSKLLQRLVSKSTRPRQSLKPFQTRMEYLHLKMRWAADSGSLLQSWQGPQFSHPLRNRRSDVHTLFWRINQAKVLHFGGSQLAQTAGTIKEVGVAVN